MYFSNFSSVKVTSNVATPTQTAVSVSFNTFVLASFQPNATLAIAPIEK